MGTAITLDGHSPAVEERGGPEPDGGAVTITSGLRALLPFARPARLALAVAGVAGAMSALLTLVPYWAIYRVIDLLVTGTPTRDDLWRLALVALSAVLGRFALFGLSLYISHVGAYQVLYEIRIAMAEHLARVPLGTVTRRRSGELKKVMGDDVERLEMFLAHGLPDLMAAAVTLFAVPIWLFVVDWRMGLATVVLVIPAFASLSLAMRRSMASMDDYHRTLGDLNASIVEIVRGMPVVKVFNRGSNRVRSAEQSVTEHVEVVKRYSGAFLPFGTAFFVLPAANIALIVPLGVWLNGRGSLTTSELLFFFLLGLGALVPVQTLLYLFANLSHLTTGGNLVREVLDAATLEDLADGAVPADASVELRDVSFGYGDTEVLSEVSFRCQPGTVTALVGPSGAGKSTIAALIARFWDVDRGAVLLGGVDLRELPTEVLTRQVSTVLQEPFLFDDTIKANLGLARPGVSDDEIVAAASAAQAHGFISALPDGYDTMVGERGARLSGGERQRLTLARALLADTPVVVLDEATSFADPENEALIQDAIGALVAGRTVVMIAHRLSTVAGADQILVVDGGRIVERGRHDDLVAAGGLYARLWNDFSAASEISLGAAVRDGRQASGQTSASTAGASDGASR